MAKQPIETDVFKVEFEVPVEGLGPVVAILTKMGFANVRYGLVTNVRQFGSNKQYAETATTTALRVLQDGKEHASMEIREAFSAVGRDPSSAPSAIKQLMDKNHVRKTGHATYQATAAGLELAAGNSAVAAHMDEQPRAPRKTFTETGREVAERILSDGKPHSLDDMRAVFTEQGRTPQSISPNLDLLLKAGTVKRVSQGVYQLTKAPKVAKAPNGTTRVRHADTNSIILTALQSGPKPWADLLAIWEAKDRTLSSLKSAIDRLRKTKIIKNSDEGYTLLDTKAATAAIAKAMNGNKQEAPHG